jgi:hypothetical protein
MEEEVANKVHVLKMTHLSAIWGPSHTGVENIKGTYQSLAASGWKDTSQRAIVKSRGLWCQKHYHPSFLRGIILVAPGGVRSTSGTPEKRERSILHQGAGSVDGWSMNHLMLNSLYPTWAFAWFWILHGENPDTCLPA